jgi:hypothetical protein
MIYICLIYSAHTFHIKITLQVEKPVSTVNIKREAQNTYFFFEKNN